MKTIRAWAAAALAAALLAACGGGGDGDQNPRVNYSKLVSFGDSLSDVGTYRVSTIAAVGGGEYSVNGSAGVNWTERIAAQARLPAPCAARTGLQSIIPQIPAVPIVDHAGCYGYAQGGARVTSPLGVENINLPGSHLGQLTDPVVEQITRHLQASGGKFTGDELVTVLAGGNDAIVNLQLLALGQITPQDAVVALATAGGELAAYVKQLIVGNGATHVIVVNLPDLSQTPFAYALSAETQGLINTMVVQFNAQLSSGLAGTPGVLMIDAYAQGRDQVAHPAQYELVNVTDTACDLTKTPIPSSLVCTDQTLIAGDVSRYEFADTVHPTPFGYELLARFVLRSVYQVGWL